MWARKGSSGRMKRRREVGHRWFQKLGRTFLEKTTEKGQDHINVPNYKNRRIATKEKNKQAHEKTNFEKRMD
jgi:hypothetical protein